MNPKRILASQVAGRVVHHLGHLDISDLLTLADELHSQDKDLARRMAYALGSIVCGELENQPEEANVQESLDFLVKRGLIEKDEDDEGGYHVFLPPERR